MRHLPINDTLHLYLQYYYILFNQINKKQSESRTGVDSGNQKTQHKTYDNPQHNIEMSKLKPLLPVNNRPIDFLLLLVLVVPQFALPLLQLFALS